jgi:hypothetical protein
MKNFFSIFAVIAVLSCASYEMVSTSVLHEPAHLKDLQGSSLTILPIDINYGAINLTIDLRDVQIRVNGQAVTLQDQYLMEYEDDELGTIGVLDSNIFELAGLDKAKLGAYASERFIALMRGEATYTEPFFRGFGAGDMGHLSNQAINWDYEAVNPPQPVYYGDPAPWSSLPSWTSTMLKAITSKTPIMSSKWKCNSPQKWVKSFQVEKKITTALLFLLHQDQKKETMCFSSDPASTTNCWMPTETKSSIATSPTNILSTTMTFEKSSCPLPLVTPMPSPNTSGILTMSPSLWN